MGLPLRFFRCLLLLLGVALTAPAGTEDTPAKRTADPPAKSAADAGKTKASATQPFEALPPLSEKKGPGAAPSPLEALRVPAGAVIVICQDVKDALQLVPRAIVLSVDEYQKLLDQIDQLKRQNKPDKPINPSTCRVSGRVADEQAHLEMQFEFYTERPQTLVNLGCQRAWPTDAKLDGEVGWLQAGEDGFVMQVDKPGAHVAKVNLVLPVVARRGFKGSGHGFELDLPGAAIATLDQFDLPGAAVEVMVGARSVRPKQLDSQRSRLESVTIAPAGSAESVQRLDLTWKGPASEPAKGPTVLSALGRIIVHVDEAHVSTDAELELRVIRGETAEWRVRVPLIAESIQEVKVQPRDEARIQAIERIVDKQGTLITVRLKEPMKEAGDEPLKLTLRLQQDQTGNAVPVGPLPVLGVLAQRGEIEIRSPDELRLHYQKHGNVGQREISDEQRRDNVRAVFQYWSAAGNLPGTAPPWVTVQAERVKGSVEARITHNLRVLPGDEGATPKFRLATRLDVAPVRTGIDRLELSLPPGYDYESKLGPSPVDLVEDVTLDSQARIIQVKLAHKQYKQFSITLPGVYPVPPGIQETTLTLPRPLRWSIERTVQSERPGPDPNRAALLDRGGQVTITFPEGLMATGNPGVQESGSAKIQDVLAETPGAREYTWQAQRAPARVVLAWQAHQPDLEVDSLFDITLSGRQAHVRERLDFHFSQVPPSDVSLHVPPGLLGEIRILEGGALAVPMAKPHAEWRVRLAGPPEQQKHLVLQYAFPLPENVRGARADVGDHFSIPLVRAKNATRGTIKLRVWGNPGDEIKFSGGQWEELRAEIVSGRDSLPALVIRGGLESPLTLHRQAAPISGLAKAVVERALLHAIISPRAVQACRARFRLVKLNAHTLDIHLPVLMTNTGVEVSLDNRRVPIRLMDGTSKDAGTGKIARLQLEPDLYSKPVILDVSYQVDLVQQGFHSPFQLTCYPPTIADAVFLGRARWQIDLPPDEMAIYPGADYTAEQHWRLWGWLLAPRPAWTGQELEQWFTEDYTAPPTEASEPALVCWQTSLTPLSLVHAPQRFWLLVCSLVFLGLGLGLFYLPLPRFLLWTSVIIFGGIVASVGIVWPGTFPSLIYGCEPGAAVLLLVIAFQWTLHERYRRKVVFMPGFTRLKPGSSLVRTGSSNRKRELSTVDEPPKRGSSVSKGSKA